MLEVYVFGVQSIQKEMNVGLISQSEKRRDSWIVHYVTCDTTKQDKPFSIEAEMKQ